MKTRKGPISWMTNNKVAANLLMFILIFGGLLIATQVKKEVFPEFEIDIIRVSVIYPGASPEEIEEGIVLAIEDEVRALDGVKRVTSTSLEGKGNVNIELLRGVNSGKVLQDVKNTVDRIQSFPEEAEKPIVSLLEPRRQVISLIVYGNGELRTLNDIAERMRDELIHIPGITLVQIADVPPLEISIEVPTEKLREYNLKLGQIAGIVKSTALDLPGGGVKEKGGEILLRTQEKRDFASQFEDIVIISKPDGTKLNLADIAQISEKFAETDQESYFNGLPAIKVDIFRVGDENPLDISDKVLTYAAELREKLPETIKISSWNDSAEIFRDRIDLLLKNAFLGLILVLLLLGLFLEPMLAFWVTLGIPVSIIGSFLFMPLTGVSINMISLFAFIVTLGIIVDDAILVGENIYYKRERGMNFFKASIEGAVEMAGPVTFAVLTNIASFSPLLFVPGTMGRFFFQIPAIVVAVFTVSLIESLFVLPAHLTYKHNKGKIWKTLNKPNKLFEAWLHRFIDNKFMPLIKYALLYRYLTMTIAISIMMITGAFFINGHIPFSFLPRIDSDLANAQIVLPFGVSINKSRNIQNILTDGAKRVLEKTEGDKISRGIFVQIGSTIPGMGPRRDEQEMSGTHLVGAQVFLAPPDQRKIGGIEFANLWREEVGEIMGIESSSFSGIVQTTAGKPIEIQLSHLEREINEQAAHDLATELKNYRGVIDIDDGVTLGKPQISFKVKPLARGLQITSKDLADQVRNAFYGAEAFRQQRGRNEMKIMVRLPEEERKKISTVEELLIRTNTGGEIPIFEAANIDYGRAYTSIKRTNGRRIQAVTADVNEKITNANQVINDLKDNFLPTLIRKYPGLSYNLEGEQREQRETINALAVGFTFALFLIYSLLALPFQSYIQPIIVMLSIPFGIIGAILGHLLLGYNLSIISMFGIVALSGVVVNDSLVLIVTINSNLKNGMRLINSVLDAAKRRFRPIMLTSLTTFFGLSPMIFETSLQARFLIPMAISLGFGILFSTAIIMLITTSVYLIVEDVKRFFIVKINKEPEF